MLLIKKPDYFKASYIYSRNLRKALAESDLLVFLRSLFNEDSNKFYDLRDEMILRAFRFSIELRSNMFPALMFEAKSIIVINSNESRYKNIPTDITGIHHLLSRYNVTNDYFFNYVSIEAISYVLKKDFEFIKIQFERAGFQIVNEQQVAFVDKNTEDVMPNEHFDELGEINKIINEVKGENVEIETATNSSCLVDETLIEDIFSGRTFLVFQNYCNKKNILFFSQLTLDDIESFQYEKSVGTKKYALVKDYYHNYLQQYEFSVQEEVKAQTKKSTSVGNIFNYFQHNAVRRLLEHNSLDYKVFIDDLYGECFCVEHFQKFKEKVQQLAIKEKRVQLLEKGQIFGEKIRQHPLYSFLEHFKWGHFAKLFRLEHLSIEIDQYFFEIISDEDYFDYLDIFVSVLENYVPFNERLRKLREDFSDRTITVLMMRQSSSLEMVGQQIGVTRERVRQIEKKNSAKIINFLSINRFEVIIRHFLAENSHLYREKLFKMLQLDKENEIFISIYLKDNPHFSITDNVIVDNEFKVYVDQVVEVIIHRAQDIWNVDEILYQFNSNKDYEINEHFIEEIMNRLNYYRKNNLYIKRTIKLPALIRYIFKYKINGALEITDDNFEKLQELMGETFNIQFENGKRAAIARIRDTENVILVDGNTFMYYDLNEVPQQLITEISGKLEGILVTDGMTTAMTIFKMYEEVWNKFMIYSHFHLYSIIHYFFKDDYAIGQGNTLSIRVLGGEVVDAFTLLYRYLKSAGVSTKKDIMDALKWPIYKLEQLVIRNEQFHQIELDNGAIGIMLFENYQFTNEELQKIKIFYEQYMQCDYVYVQDLMIEMEFKDEVSDILADKGIMKLYDFASLLKYLDKDLRGFQQFLYKKESVYCRIEPVIAKDFPNILKRKELEDYYVDKGFALSGLTSLLATLVEENLFYPYTGSQYINANTVQLAEENLSALKNYLDEQFVNKEYLPSQDLTGYSTLPSIGQYDWTPRLIAHFVSRVGYRLINTTRDYRYNKLIIVPAYVEVTQYDELVYKVIKEEYEGNFHEQDIAKFLVHKKLLHSPQISIELKGSGLFELKELGFIALKEV